MTQDSSWGVRFGVVLGAVLTGSVHCGSDAADDGSAGRATAGEGTSSSGAGRGSEAAAGSEDFGGAAGQAHDPDTGGSGGRLGTGGSSAGSGGAGPGSTGGTNTTGGSGAADAESSIASKYPCDLGIEDDPAFVFKEDFEETSVSFLRERYSDSSGEPSSMALSPDIPESGCGKTSGRFTASPSADTSSLFQQLTGTDEIYYRAYVKYEAEITWHHTGLSIKGYNPPSPWPLGLAGLKPSGEDSFSVALEPVHGVGEPNPRFDFYAYWMNMRSWMDEPEGNQAYYGNSLVHQNAFTTDDDTWICVEVHLKLNTDISSSAGAELDVWKNDVLVQHFGSEAPLGCWIKDKFCPLGADGPECTDYPSLCAEPYVPLDLQWRSTTELQITGIGFGNYITAGTEGSVQFDHIVVARGRIGCVRNDGG